MIRPWQRLQDAFARWPIQPPWWLRQPVVWVSLVVGGVGLDILTPVGMTFEPLRLVAVLLAAWSGRGVWTVAMAAVSAAAPLAVRLWQPTPWPLWVSLANVGQRLLVQLVVAALMTALQRHAVRLTLERDPQLSGAGERRWW